MGIGVKTEPYVGVYGIIRSSDTNKSVVKFYEYTDEQLVVKQRNLEKEVRFMTQPEYESMPPRTKDWLIATSKKIQAENFDATQKWVDDHARYHAELQDRGECNGCM